MQTTAPYDLIIGLDRSDTKADLHLINTRTGQRRSETITTSPENLWEWLAQLRQEHPQAHVAICLEQPAVHLIPFLETYNWITLFPINPLTLQKFREAFVTSRAKDDAKDAFYLAELLLVHADKLKAWAPEDAPTRGLQHKVFHRRSVIDERTGLTNRLQAMLKQYFPQALALCGEDLWRPLATAFLLKWPSLQAVQKAKPATLTQFYHLNGSRSAKLLQQRLALVKKAVPVTDEPALIESFVLRVRLICRELQQVVATIKEYDRQIAQGFAQHPDMTSSKASRAPAPFWLPACWPAWARTGNDSSRPITSSAIPASPRSPSKAAASATFTGATSAPSTTGRVSTNMPRKVSSGAAGQPPAICANERLRHGAPGAIDMEQRHDRAVA